MIWNSVRVFIALLFCQALAAQNVQWASSIVNYSSQSENGLYSAMQALGAPNSMQTGGMSGTAWLAKDDTRKEFLHVAFEKPMKVAQVIVAESFNPGAVVKIVLFNQAGIETEVFKQKADTLEEKWRVLSVKIPLTDFEVTALKVFIDCRVTPGANQIDAIGISDSHEELKFESRLKKVDATYFSKAERLDDNVNTQFTEVNPKISPDGKTLFITRKDYPPNHHDDEIWFSKLEDGKWSKMQNIGEPLNNQHPNAIESITPDGNTCLLINQYFKKTGATAPGFSISNRLKEGWSFPENANLINFINNDRYTGFYLSNDGKTVITQLRREDTKGSSDLYVMFLQDDGRWSEPLSLGDSVNTEGGDCTAFLASDNVTLYYSTDGLPGYGSNDIYMTRRKDDTWKNWTTPLNIGPDINSDAWDAYYSIPASGDWAYFVKDGDIYRIRLREEFRPKPVLLISGFVYNQKTNQIIPEASINYEYLPDGGNAGTARTNPANGEYKIVLPYGHNYGFLADAKGFLSVSDHIDASNLHEYTEIRRDLYLVPAEVGQVVRMNNIFFDFAKSTLRPESFPELDRIAKFLAENPAISISIGGHTDNVGQDDDNLTLSANRAKSVLDYLSSKGVSAGRMTSNGFGETQPQSTNETEEGRQLNRRVEFVIVKM